MLVFHILSRFFTKVFFIFCRHHLPEIKNQILPFSLFFVLKISNRNITPSFKQQNEKVLAFSLFFCFRMIKTKNKEESARRCFLSSFFTLLLLFTRKDVYLIPPPLSFEFVIPNVKLKRLQNNLLESLNQ